MTMMWPPRPVNVPPTDVANRYPRAVSSISVSEFLYGPIRAVGKTDRYQGPYSNPSRPLTARNQVHYFVGKLGAVSSLRVPRTQRPNDRRLLVERHPAVAHEGC
jgi:hypothetical protein